MVYGGNNFVKVLSLPFWVVSDLLLETDWQLDMVLEANKETSFLKM